MSAALEAQIRAAAPDASSWVSANAGSGKTRVLTDRVARLLLSGTDPRKVLCLTYTKAAAAEMQNRLFRTLGKWAMLGDADLRAALRDLGEPGEAIAAADLDRARTLFARALETPGGLKIETIHAFCDTLLRRFPLEAGVAPQFDVLEDRQARALREEVLDALAEAEPALFAGLARHLSGDDPDPLLKEIAHNRAAFAGPFDRDRLVALLGISSDLTAGDLAAAVLLPADVEIIGRIATLALGSGVKDRGVGETLRDALRQGDPDARLELLEAALLTKSGANPFTAKIGAFPARALRTAHPALAAQLDALMARVESARPRRLAILALAKSVALNSFARAFLARYDARKHALGLLDFDDLIQRARLLLDRPETAAWVLYRLDGGLDHILVDEAQDTSPAQWQVIEAISAEFFSGLGARGLTRTIFVVGDEKQSIYSFQGADPAAFGEMRGRYDRLLANMDAELRRCDLLYSFRSAPPILRLVDAVFRDADGVALGAGTVHHAYTPERPGRVELWPFLPKPDKPEEPPWDHPLDALTPDDPVAVLADRVAARIRGWLDDCQPLPGAGRAVRPGDVLILVQSRGPIFHAVIRALKAARVPVAGADVLRLGAELAVKDLLAALRFAATPGDDLSLAAFLRGPLGGVSETELFQLAHARSASLWSELRAAPAGRWAPARALLSDMLARADYLRPFEMLGRMLVRHDGRRRLIARLGVEAEDGIDALLDQALAYESVEAPSLTGFLAWIDRDEMTVKRRLDDGADQARVMTVHGAKGLEAPIVILPDTAPRRDGGNPPQIALLEDGAAVWRMRADAAPPLLSEAEEARRARSRAENRRLLYVALTRAKSWLIVAGAGAAPKPDDDSWHDMVEAALAALDPTRETGPEGDTLVLAHNWAVTEPQSAPGAPPPDASLPGWATHPAPTLGARRAPPLSPSGLGGGHALASDAALPEAEALARGEAIHLLLERLRDRPSPAWPELAARLLPHRPDRADLLAEAAAVLTDPALAALFGPESLAEVEITASLPDLAGGRILGRIDRLVVGPDQILAVDFKSNRGVPARPEDVPGGILRQMGAYRAALAAIWPDRRIETAILWTHAARLMPLPEALVQAALIRAGALTR